MAAPKKSREAEEEVPLSGDLAQFRTALREEIDAARKAASSSAVPLVNGRRIGEGAFGRQYLFIVESALNLPDGAPGDLMIPDHPPLEATVISIDGMAITLSLSQDAGDFIPRARLQSSLVHLLRKLIERIEGMADRDNPAGARLLGQVSPGGVPVDERVTSLNEFQAEAVASALGRDTTFVWGPPGTGIATRIVTLPLQSIAKVVYARVPGRFDRRRPPVRVTPTASLPPRRLGWGSMTDISTMTAACSAPPEPIIWWEAPTCCRSETRAASRLVGG